MGLYEKLKAVRSKPPPPKPQKGGLLAIALARGEGSAAAAPSRIPEQTPALSADQPIDTMESPESRVSEDLPLDIEAPPGLADLVEEPALKSTEVALAAGDLEDLEDLVERTADQEGPTIETEAAELTEEIESVQVPLEDDAEEIGGAHVPPSLSVDAGLDESLRMVTSLRRGVESPAYLFQALVERFQPDRAMLLLYDSWTRALVPAATHGWEARTGFTVTPTEAAAELRKTRPFRIKAAELSYLANIFDADDELLIRSFVSEGMANGMFLAKGAADSELLEEILSDEMVDQLVDESTARTTTFGTVQLDYLSGDTVAAGGSELMEVSCLRLLEGMRVENPTISRNWLRQILLRIVGSLFQSVGKVAVTEAGTLKVLTKREIDHELLTHQARAVLTDLLRVTAVDRTPVVTKA